MDLQDEQFVIMVADLCTGAWLARLPVEVLTVDGTRCSGVPQPPVPAADDDEFDATGVARDLTIGAETLPVEAIVEIRARRRCATGI